MKELIRRPQHGIAFLISNPENDQLLIQQGINLQDFPLFRSAQDLFARMNKNVNEKIQLASIVVDEDHFIKEQKKHLYDYLADCDSLPTVIVCYNPESRYKQTLIKNIESHASSGHHLFLSPEELANSLFSSFEQFKHYRQSLQTICQQIEQQTLQKLTGTLKHEFNNSLTILLLSLERLQDDYKINENNNYLKKIESSIFNIQQTLRALENVHELGTIQYGRFSRIYDIKK